MDLDEFLFYEKKKNKDFLDFEFAEKLGITRHHLSNLRHGKFVPSARLAYKIYIATDKKVDVWKMIIKYYEKKDI